MNGPNRASLSVSIVTFPPEANIVRRALNTLGDVLAQTGSQCVLGEATVALVDNGLGVDALSVVRGVGQALSGTDRALLRVNIESSHRNAGYGAGHSIQIHAAQALRRIPFGVTASWAPLFED